MLLGDSKDFNDPFEEVLDGGGEFGGEGRHGEFERSGWLWKSMGRCEVERRKGE